ncbi:SAP domain-containing protein [Loigolactobacillus jiayinensis]|uniref:SAP domain-containing protein n=1 Tax=Loigolactobacillus jiayinensis TaxID=2486016 RepID=A0ABW1RCP9_9LACO|nr:SAP domain-containing protein [Loigolactobacillus jiayinensis]
MTTIKILALALAADQPNTFTLTQSFWQHRYRVQTQGWLAKFEQAGLLQQATAPMLSLQQKTVAQLKQLLRTYHLKVSGRKVDLLNRLQTELTAAELVRQCPQQFYRLTPAGIELVQQHRSVQWLHDYYVAGIIDFTAAKRTQLPTDLTLDATLAWLLDAAQVQAQQQSNWPQIYYVAHIRFQIAWQRQHVGTALNALLDCIYLKLAGVTQVEKATRATLDWQTTAYKVEPFYNYILQQIMHDYHMTTDDISSAFAQRCQHLAVPHKLFSDSEMQQLLLWALTGQDQLSQQLYQTKKARYEGAVS